jgi:hypothetical protein
LHNIKIKDEKIENLEQTFDVKLKKHKKSKWRHGRHYLDRETQILFWALKQYLKTFVAI